MIESNSGVVETDLVLGSMMKVKTGSANMDLRLTSFPFGNTASTLRTSSGSGTQEIFIVNEVAGLNSMHHSGSGTLTLRYPAGWGGIIHGHTGSGEIILHNHEGMEVLENEDDSNSGHHLHMKRGNGNSTMRFHTGSGSVEVFFG